MRIPRVRFGVRALLLAVALLALVLARSVVSARQQARAVDAIRQAGGLVIYDFQYDDGRIDPDERRRSPYPDWLRRRLGDDALHDVAAVVLHYEHRWADPADFAPVRSLGSLRLLALRLDSMDAATARWISELSGLEYLTLEFGPGATAAAEVRLTRLGRLRSLDLGDGAPAAIVASLGAPGALRALSVRDRRADDQWLAHVARLEDLESLGLSGTGVTDEGVSRLGRLPRLRELDLSGTRVSDAAIPALLRLPALESLSVLSTGISEEGRRRLAGRVHVPFYTGAGRPDR